MLNTNTDQISTSQEVFTVNQYDTYQKFITVRILNKEPIPEGF